MTKLLGSFCFFVVCIASKTFCQVSDSIDAYVRKAMIDQHIPGAAVAVVKNGKVIKEGYYGYANLEDSTLVTSQSVFEIASMSKQFTCAAILLLQQDGKISVNDFASKYLDSLPTTWQNITIKQLMNHTSGLRDDWEESTGYFLENFTDEKMFAAQKKVPLRFKPGESFNYSSGPFDLGLIIKKITGQTYAKFLQERIFKVLGMTATSIYDTRRVVPHRVHGYVWSDSLQMYRNGHDISSAAEARGDVGVITSLPDMIKWDAAMKNSQLLNEKSRKEMFEAGTLNDGTRISAGYGWFIFPIAGHLVIEHSGGFRTGFTSDIMRFPDIDLDIIFFCNQWNGFLSSVQIASIADTSIKSLSKMKLQKDPDVKRTQLLTTLIENMVLNKGKDSALYKRIFLGADPQMLSNSFLAGFKGLTFIDSRDLRARPIIAYGEKISKIIHYRMEGGKGMFLSFYFNDSDKLICLYPDWGD